MKKLLVTLSLAGLYALPLENGIAAGAGPRPKAPRVVCKHRDLVPWRPAKSTLPEGADGIQCGSFRLFSSS